MKMKFRLIAIAAMIAATSSFHAVQAQSQIGIVQMDVPFAFDYGSQQFAPGVYTVKMQGDSSNPRVVVLSNGRSSGLAMTEMENNREPVKTSHVVFTKYGDRYFLDQIWITGNATHLAVYESKWEKKAARESASEKIASSQIELPISHTTSAGN